MSERVLRLSALTGVVFAVLSGVTIAITPTSPRSQTSGARVIVFYEAHRSVERASAILGVLALAFFMFFAASLRSYLRRTESGEGLAALVLSAASILTVGLTVSAGFAFALADTPNALSIASAQTLNLLDEDVFFAIAAGTGLFALAAGLAILRTASLPRWLGWSGLLIGIVSFTPAFGIALLGLSIWGAITSILLYLRTAHPLAAAPAEHAPAAVVPSAL